MPRKKTTPPPGTGITISNCTFTSAANDNTRAAVEALASAAKANADAIQQWLGGGGDIRPLTKRGPNDGGGNGGSPSDPSPTPRK